MPEQSFINRNIEFRFFATLLVSVSLLIVTSYVLGSKVERGDASMPTEAALKPFPEVALTAKAAYVYDARTKTVLLALNENTRMPLASLTKLMTALVATELSPEYGAVTVSRQALSAEGDSGLLAGEKWSLKNLLDFSLVSSSNDGMRAVALAFGALERSDASPQDIIDDFVREMNQKAAALDLKNTYYWNETGLDESEFKGGAYGTAKDMATLLENVITYHPELLEATRYPSLSVTSLDNFKHEAKNTNILVGRIPGLLGSKTGFDDEARGALLLLYRLAPTDPAALVILRSADRFADGREFLEWLESSFVIESP